MSDISQSLKTAIFNTMERMFFLLPDPDGEGDVISGGRSVVIGITGAPRYLLTLVFEPDLADAMAANALGKKGVDAAMLNKCLLEAANVIAGNFLHHWDGSYERNITLPSLDRGAVFDRFIPGDSRFARFTFEGMSLEVRIETGGEA